MISDQSTNNRLNLRMSNPKNLTEQFKYIEETIIHTQSHLRNLSLADFQNLVKFALMRITINEIGRKCIELKKCGQQTQMSGTFLPPSPTLPIRIDDIGSSQQLQDAHSRVREMQNNQQVRLKKVQESQKTPMNTSEVEESLNRQMQEHEQMYKQRWQKNHEQRRLTRLEEACLKLRLS